MKGRGKRTSWEDLFLDKTKNNLITPKIQKAEREDGTTTIQVFMPLTQINKKYSAVSYEPSYPAIKAIIQGLVEVHNKEEVERELGVKIGGEKDE